MNDLIRREDAIEVAYQLRRKPNDDEWNDEWLRSLNAIPTIDATSVVHGEWEERETFHNADDNPIIEEWQSARCSVCNKYHTTPYMYYFSDYNFCPNCGAKMDREREDK